MPQRILPMTDSSSKPQSHLARDLPGNGFRQIRLPLCEINGQHQSENAISNDNKKGLHSKKPGMMTDTLGSSDEMMQKKILAAILSC